MSEAARAELRLRKLGFVFQSYNLVPVLSALENVEFVLLLQHVPRARAPRARAPRSSTELGLGELADKRPGEMSGGQQQRVAVARAIASEPEIVLADEPTANLDSKTAEDLLDLMERHEPRARRHLPVQHARPARDGARAARDPPGRRPHRERRAARGVTRAGALGSRSRSSRGAAPARPRVRLRRLEARLQLDA